MKKLISLILTVVFSTPLLAGVNLKNSNCTLDNNVACNSSYELNSIKALNEKANRLVDEMSEMNPWDADYKAVVEEHLETINKMRKILAKDIERFYELESSK